MSRVVQSLCAVTITLSACGNLPINTATRAAAVPEVWQTPQDHFMQRFPVENQWWRAIGDPVLDNLIHRALEHNVDLRNASARVAEARALADAQRSTDYPTLDFAAAAQRSRGISAATGKPYDSAVFQPQFQAAYEVDLWGRIAAMNRASDAGLHANITARDSAFLSVAATVATAYIGLRSLDARLLVAQETLASREAALKLARSRQQSGYSSSLETRQSEAEYRATAAVVPQLTLALRRQEHSIALLTGEAPGKVARGLALTALQLAPVPDAGVPSQLIRRRPDIASAEAQLAATDAQLAAARAQLLPSLKLTASLGSFSSSALTGDPFRLWSVGGSILAPIFDSRRLHAQVEASDARREQALAAYEKVVLTAFSEVEDQLAAIEQLNRQASDVEAQRVALQESLRVARNRYREGYASYLDELDAQRNLFSAQQAALQLLADRLSAGVALNRALGGGWLAGRVTLE